MLFGRQLDFFYVIHHASLVVLTLDGITSFLQQMNIQNVLKTMFQSKQDVLAEICCLIYHCRSVICG